MWPLSVKATTVRDTGGVAGYGKDAIERGKHVLVCWTKNRYQQYVIRQAPSVRQVVDKQTESRKLVYSGTLIIYLPMYTFYLVPHATFHNLYFPVYVYGQ